MTGSDRKGASSLSHAELDTSAVLINSKLMGYFISG